LNLTVRDCIVLPVSTNFDVGGSRPENGVVLLLFPYFLDVRKLFAVSLLSSPTIFHSIGSKAEV